MGSSYLNLTIEDPDGADVPPLIPSESSSSAINSSGGYNIRGFLELSFIDWQGKLSCCIFLGGCSLRCPFCHNHRLVLHPKDLFPIDLESILEHISKKSQWLEGAVISGGEPTINPNIIELCQNLKKTGLLIKLDTNGTRPNILEILVVPPQAKEKVVAPLAAVAPQAAEHHSQWSHQWHRLVDYVALDIKAPFDAVKYSKVCGVPVNPELIGKIQKSLKIIKDSGVEYELRTTLCRALHSEADILQMAQDLKDEKKWVLQNFNPKDPLDPELKEILPYSEEEKKEILKLIKPWVPKASWR